MSTIGRYTTLPKIPIKNTMAPDSICFPPINWWIEWLAPLVAFDQIQVQGVVLREGLW